MDFTIEVERSMRVLDGAVMVYCAVGGVQPQSETVALPIQAQVPPGLCEQDGSHRCQLLQDVDQMKGPLNANPCQSWCPLVEDNFRGVVDLLKMKAIIWDEAPRHEV